MCVYSVEMRLAEDEEDSKMYVGSVQTYPSQFISSYGLEIIL